MRLRHVILADYGVTNRTFAIVVTIVFVIAVALWLAGADVGQILHDALPLVICMIVGVALFVSHVVVTEVAWRQKEGRGGDAA